MGRRRFAAGDRTRGFVLLDVVMAFAVIGLMLSVVWIRLPPRTGPQGLFALAYEAEAMLREARTAAERQGQDVAVIIDGPAHRLQSGARALRLPRDLRAGMVASSCGSQTAIVFHADGTSCSTLLRMTTATADLRILVEGVTGDVRIVAP